MIKKILTTLLFAATTTLAASEVTYLNVCQLRPGQVRFSSANVAQKIDQALKKQDVVWNAECGCYRGKYFDGKSLFPESDALPVIKAPFGLVLADGHHHTLAALSLGVKWVPVKTIADLSDLSEADFWKVAESKGWVFLYDLNGCKMTPLYDFNHLIDDPNRYFAAITARKYPANGDVKASTGAEYPLWIKVGKDIPFIEFYISDVLRAAGIEYCYEMGDQPDSAFVEKAREVLLKAQIPGLRVVPKRTHFSQLSLEKK